MDSALGYARLPERLHRFLLLHRAHALRVAGRYADAASDYDALWQASDEFTMEAGYWLADYHYLDGRFDDALSGLDQLFTESAQLHGEALRLRGHIHRVNALFDRAEAYYREALDLARDTGNIAAQGKALTDIVQTLAWRDPEAARHMQSRAVEVNDGIRNHVELVKLHAATAVLLTNLDDLDGADGEIERGLTLTEHIEYPGGEIWCQVARTWNRVRRSDRDGAREAAARVARIATELGGNRFWGEITRWWSGLAEGGGQEPARWIGGLDQSRARWEAVGGDR